MRFLSIARMAELPKNPFRYLSIEAAVVHELSTPRIETLVAIWRALSGAPRVTAWVSVKSPD